MTDDAVIEQISVAFRDARATALERAPIPPAGENVCRYCGAYWRRWDRSILDGHAQCIVTPEFRAWLRVILNDHPRVSYRDVAAKLGVSATTVSAWYRTDPRPRKRVDLRIARV